MKSKPTYTVITVDGSVIGPVTASDISNFVAVYLISPDSQIRQGDDGDWVSFTDVADSIGIDLPSIKQWNLDREAFLAKEREDKKNINIGCAVFGLIGLGVVAFMGFGFLIVPFITFCVLYVVFCKIMNLFCDVDVLSAPMWTDIREKPAEGSMLQFLAGGLAMIVLIARYLIPILYS